MQTEPLTEDEELLREFMDALIIYLALPLSAVLVGVAAYEVFFK